MLLGAADGIEAQISGVIGTGDRAVRIERAVGASRTSRGSAARSGRVTGRCRTTATCTWRGRGEGRCGRCRHGDRVRRTRRNHHRRRRVGGYVSTGCRRLPVRLVNDQRQYRQGKNRCYAKPPHVTTPDAVSRVAKNQQVIASRATSYTISSFIERCATFPDRRSRDDGGDRGGGFSGIAIGRRRMNSRAGRFGRMSALPGSQAKRSEGCETKGRSIVPNGCA